MVADRNDGPLIEPERYELSDPPSYDFTISRRTFIESAGAGLIVLVAARDAFAIGPLGEHQESDAVAAWLHIAEDGAVTVFTGKVEVGQDIRTSLTQAVAEELHVPAHAVKLVMGDTDRVPFDAGTFGSRSTPQMGMQLRTAAAAAKKALFERAAEEWRVDVATLSVADGVVRHARSGRTASIGQLTRGERIVRTIDDDVALTPADRWTVCGTSMLKMTGHDIVTGRHLYTSDLRPDGALVGMMLRPPAFDARLTALDAREAELMPGVVVVHDGDFAGVAAPDAPTAARALAALRPEWSTSPHRLSHIDVFDHLRRTGEPGRSNGHGSIEAGLADAEVTLDARYTTAYIAHVPLEPRAAVAQWQDGKLTVWTGTQRPFGVRTELSRAFHVPEERVRVIMPDTGSAYGGKHSGETAIEAARLARAARRPVRLVWTREEEFTWAYFRPAAVIDVRSGTRGDGTLSAWDFHNYNAGASGIALRYDARNVRTTFHRADSPLRQGSYRALAATANTFARETHMDEIAARLDIDPLELRLRNLREPRLRAVLEAAADRFGWSHSRRAPGRGIGIACGVEKGGYVATCAEVAAVPGNGSQRIAIERIVVSFECGAVVNPDGLRNQVEGAIVMGIGGALWEEIEFENGRILNPRLSRYRVPRMSDVPPIDVVLLDRKDLPSAGAGETPIIALAPAIGSAVFGATGVRARALPLGLDH